MRGIWDKVLEKERWALGVLAAVGFAAYAGTFFNPFAGKDQVLILNWPLVRHITNFPLFFSGYVGPLDGQVEYAPLKALLFSVTHLLFGTHPFAYHLLSVVIHLCGIWAVYQLIQLLAENRAVSFLGALFFAIHPVHTGAVAFMSAISDTAGFVLLLVAFYFYVRQSGSGDYVWSISLSALAIFMNPLTVSIPLLFLLYDVLFSSQRIGRKRVLIRPVPFFLLAVFYFLVKHHVLSGIIMADLSTPASIFAIMKGHAFSLNIFTAVLIVVMLVAGIVFYRRDDPLPAFCAGWFVLSLIPMIQIRPGILYNFNPYLYAASFGVFCFGAYVVISAGKIFRPKRTYYYALIAVIAVWLGACFVSTVMNIRDYRSGIAMYEKALRFAPRDADLRLSLASLYVEHGMIDKATKEFQAAAAERPDDPECYFLMEEASSFLKKYKQSSAYLKKAIELKPDYAEAYFNLAGLTTFRGEAEEGYGYFEKAIDIWKAKGMIIEAGQAFESFHLFLLNRGRNGGLSSSAAQKVIDSLLNK